LSGAVSDTNGIASVQIYDGTTLLGTAAVTGGNWTYTTGVLIDGAHRSFDQAVFGRPVFFVDDDTAADRKAEARAIGIALQILVETSSVRLRQLTPVGSAN
jgi:hypothetical protein